jgi:hypothetical protein
MEGMPCPVYFKNMIRAIQEISSFFPRKSPSSKQIRNRRFLSEMFAFFWPLFGQRKPISKLKQDRAKL